MLIVGLGNPGSKYQRNRHNVGFHVLDALASHKGAPAFRDKLKGELTRVSHADRELILLKPQTFMNLSGQSVRAAMTFFRVELRDVLVVHDELDVPFGEIRLKQGGGAAGHNGLRSIISDCGGADFARLRVGIGRPVHGTVESFVLSDFSSDERSRLDLVRGTAVAAVLTSIEHGFPTAMNQFNTRPKIV